MTYIDTQVGSMPMPQSFTHKDIFMHGRPKHYKYDDFWRRHPPMDIRHRAKIFAPFAALRGFDECIQSKEVSYVNRRDLSDDELEILRRKLSVLHALTGSAAASDTGGPCVSVTFFVPCRDPHSFAYGTQGQYQTVTGIVSHVDTTVHHSLVIDGHTILLTDILDLTGPVFDL